jgi:hypothetical protein
MIEGDYNVARPHRFDKALVEIGQSLAKWQPVVGIKTSLQDRAQFMEPPLAFRRRLDPSAVGSQAAAIHDRHRPAMIGISAREGFDASPCRDV